MRKIPLETTLVGAYRFLFTNIVSIIGTLWLPFVVCLALIGGMLYLVIPHAWLAGNLPHFENLNTPENLKAFCLTFLPVLQIYPLLLLIGLIAAAMMEVGLLRHALGLKKTTTFAYFSLGAPVWRLIAAEILACIVLVLLSIVLVVLFILVLKFGAPHIPHGFASAGAVVLGIIFVCAIFYSAFRLLFFLPAVVVAEQRIGLGRSWSLGGGNFWRIFFVFLLIVIPIGFVAGIAMQMTFMPIILGEAVKLGKHPSTAEVTTFLHALLPLLPIAVAISIIQRIVIMGLTAGAIGTAYNAIAGEAALEK